MKDNVRQEPVKIGAVDVEVFAQNLARLVEEGGKATVRMLLPVTVLILPTLFVVVLVPAAAELTRLGG